MTKSIMIRVVISLGAGLAVFLGDCAWGCDLCAVSGASLARGESTSGFVATISEQFAPSRTVQFRGERLAVPSILEEAFVDNSMTHLVAGYNFMPRFGISLNAPFVVREFKRFELRPTGIVTEEGSVSGLGDVALIGRWTAWEKSGMKAAASVQLLGGVKLPTGDTSRIEDEVRKAAAYNALFGGGVHQHEFGGVHEHALALGSGSWDGVMGASVNLRWDRWLFTGLAQYYRRTSGESGFKFGDDIMLSGGPGAFVLLNRRYTLSLHGNAFYESSARDKSLGSKSDNTGLTAWFFGPQLQFTWGTHLSANAGVDLPLRIANNGLQNVVDYRIHGGVTWRF